MVLEILLIHLAEHAQLGVKRGGFLSDRQHVGDLGVHRGVFGKRGRKRHTGVFILVGGGPQFLVEGRVLDAVRRHADGLGEVDAVRVKQLDGRKESDLPETHDEQAKEPPLRHDEAEDHVAHFCRAGDDHGDGDDGDDENRPGGLREMADLERNGRHAVRLRADPVQHFLDLGHDLDLGDDESADQDADDAARGDRRLLDLLGEMQGALQAGGKRLERVVKLAGVGTRLDETDNGVTETAGAAEGLVHVHPGVDVIPDFRERLGNRFVRQSLAIVFQGVRRVDLGAQHRTQTAEQVHLVLDFKLLDFRRLFGGGDHAFLGRL